MKRKTILDVLGIRLSGTFVKTRPSVFRCDDRFEIVAFPPFLLPVAVTVGSYGGGGSDLFGLVGHSFLDIGAIHHGNNGGGGGDKRSSLERWRGARDSRDKP